MADTLEAFKGQITDQLQERFTRSNFTPAELLDLSQYLPGANARKIIKSNFFR
jgi:hypothetical protein